MPDDQVIGGICFRPFLERGFLEIVFCAIASNQQVKGYGTYLMNHLKGYAVANKCFNFLTCVPSFSVSFLRRGEPRASLWQRRSRVPMHPSVLVSTSIVARSITRCNAQSLFSTCSNLHPSEGIELLNSNRMHIKVRRQLRNWVL